VRQGDRARARGRARIAFFAGRPSTSLHRYSTTWHCCITGPDGTQQCPNFGHTSQRCEAARNGHRADRRCDHVRKTVTPWTIYATSILAMLPSRETRWRPTLSRTARAVARMATAQTIYATSILATSPPRETRWRSTLFRTARAAARVAVARTIYATSILTTPPSCETRRRPTSSRATRASIRPCPRALQ
jgi:hypothetical protein